MTGEPRIAPGIPPPEPPRGQALDGPLRRAAAAILWEKLWPPLAAAGSVGLLFLAVSWAGVWQVLPPVARGVGVALFGALILVALAPLMRLAAPSRAAALARIDRASGRSHRPATALTDPLASTAEDPVTRALWAVHRDRAMAAARDLRSGPARPRLAARDPRALRFLAVLAAIVAFVSAGEDRAGRVLSAFDWQSPAGGTVPPRLDAWVTPPPYTGRPPIFLTASRPEDSSRVAFAEQGRAHSVPHGSVLVVRTSGGTAEIDAPGARALAPDEKAPMVPDAPRAAGSGVSDSRFALEKDTEVTVDPAGGETLVWRFQVVPDTAPKIAFRSPPRTNETGALVLDYSVEDDHGAVNAVAAVAQPVPRTAAARRPARPLYGPPEIRLVLPQGRSRSGTAMTAVELVEHPWAGTRVLMTLVARDEPGQEGRSETLETVLPMRGFGHPVARALVEQRRRLALDAEARDRVAKSLEALALFPERFTPDPSIYLGLRSAYWRLQSARTDDELRGVADYLWEIALLLEDGELNGLQNELKQAEEALREALERDAGNEEIAKLLNELREAIGRYMQELARRMEQQPNRQAALPPGARVLTPQDLKDMLDRMEELARGGNREAAQNLLAELRDLLNNLQADGGGAPDEGAEAAAKALDELGRMIREQSELRDKTFRRRQPGQQAPDQQEPGGMDDLGQQQGALKKRLQDLIGELEGKGLEGDPSLGDAGEEMGTAEGQLGKGDAGRAFGAQGRALDALRQGAQGMAERMMGGSQRGAPGQGRQAPTAQQEETDPLGRPTRTRRYDQGSTVRVPGEIDAHRARRVLEELRRRIGEPGRPQDELDYLERLLRD